MIKLFFRILKNPFFLYIFSFTSVLLVHALHWSNLYPKLGIPLKLFLLVTFILALYFGIKLEKIKDLSYLELQPDGSKSGKIVLFIWMLYIADFVYSKEIPIVSLIMGNYNYEKFGMPVLHVFAVTFSSFYTVYLFHLFFDTRNKRVLKHALLTFLPSILLFNMGMISTSVISIFFVYIFSIRRISLRTSLKLILFIFVVLYLVGLGRNIRMSGGNPWRTEGVFKISNVNKNFEKSWIPKPYYWTYLYLASPIGNFQKNTESPVIKKSISGIILYQMLPDIISKRIGPLLKKVEKRKIKLVHNWFNAPTIYAGSYAYMGWWGPYLMFFFIAGLNILYLVLLKRNNKFFITGLAILNTILLLSIFNNIFIYGGKSLQLIYPILYGFKFRIRF